MPLQQFETNPTPNLSDGDHGCLGQPLQISDFDLAVVAFEFGDDVELDDEEVWDMNEFA